MNNFFDIIIFTQQSREVAGQLCLSSVKKTLVIHPQKKWIPSLKTHQLLVSSVLEREN